MAADSDMEDLAAKTQTLQAVPIFVTSNVSGVGYACVGVELVAGGCVYRCCSCLLVAVW